MATTTNMPKMPVHSRTLSSVSSTAEDLFSSITGFDDLANDDDLSLDDMEDGGDGTGKSGAKKGKRLTSTAEKKATHNAVERARRESLNVRFLVLADMLPGMNHVKRASKAGIVNKSIALIQELQATEKRLGTENEALKAELEMVRQQFAQAQAAAAAAAASTSGMMHPMHLHAMQGINGMPNMSGMMQQPMAQPQHHMQQAMQFLAASTSSNNQNSNEDSNTTHSRRASAPSTSMPLFPGYVGMFAGNENDNGASGIKSEGAPSPASDLGKSRSVSGQNDIYAHGLFDFTSMTGGMPVTDLTGLSSSPASFSAASIGASPPGTMASLISDKASSASNSNIHNGAPNSNSNNNGSVPSPASSHSISTPGNSFSPAPLPFDMASSAASTTATSTSSPPNPVLAAFDSSSDAAFLASQYAPRDLAKAQSELQAFMAYQQRMAAMGAGMGFPSFPNAPGNGGNSSPSFSSAVVPPPQLSPGAFGMQNPMAFGFPGQFPGATPSTPLHHPGMCGPPPAWQMMMAQQQALSTYGGLGGNQF